MNCNWLREKLAHVNVSVEREPGDANGDKAFAPTEFVFAKPDLHDAMKRMPY